VKIAELGATGDTVLIEGDITDLKEEAPTIAEATVKDVKKDTFFQHSILSKQRTKPSFQRA
jgi:hypothetical protein